MAVTAEGGPTCACGNPGCNAIIAAEAWVAWIRDPERRDEDEPDAVRCQDLETEVTIQNKALVDAFYEWCEAHDWSSSGLLSLFLETFMFGEPPCTREELEAEHREGK